MGRSGDMRSLLKPAHGAAWITSAVNQKGRGNLNLSTRLLLNVVVADRVIELQKGMAAGLIQAVVWDG
jgi:hypothetical protein